LDNWRAKLGILRAKFGNWREKLETKLRAKVDWNLSGSHKKAPNDLKLFPPPLPISTMLW